MDEIVNLILLIKASINCTILKTFIVPEIQMYDLNAINNLI